MQSSVIRKGIVKRKFCKIYFLFFLSIGCVHASTAQTISLSLKKESIEKAFRSIEQQTSYRFIYSKETIQEARPVSIELSAVSIEQVLSKLFANQPLSYTMDDIYIMVKAREEKPGLPPVDVTGIVTDEEGRPLSGVSVTVKGEDRGAVTNDNGEYLLNGVDQYCVLVFSYVGREPVEIFLKARSKLSVQLKVVARSLDETIIQAYGTTTRRLSTSSISKISGRDISEQPVVNPIQAMQGRATGLFITTQNGLPGGNLKVQIRGQGSIAAGTDPLYVIDGVPFLSSPITGNGITNGAAGAISPFTLLSPGDIESIEVLKDADATALYGSRAANGVILITTKKARSDKTSFSLDFYRGISRVSRLVDYLDLREYLAFRKEAFKNDGLVPGTGNAPDLMIWDTTMSTNWQKQMLGGSAPVTNLQGSLTGGNSQTRFLMSVNYRQEGTIFPGDWNYSRGGGYLNLEHTSSNKKLFSSTSVIFSKDNSQLPYAASMYMFSSLPPNFPLYNADGSLNFSIGYNPEASLQQKAKSESENLIMNSRLRYSIVKDLNLVLNTGFTSYWIDQLSTLPKLSQDPSSSPVAMAYFNNNRNESVILEPQLEFFRGIKKGKLMMLVGGSYQRSERKGAFIAASDVSNPDLLGNLGAAVSITSKTNSYSLYKYASFFSRLNYTWARKYLFSINFRRDGSTRFGPNKRYGNFGAVGAAWIITEEDLIRKTLPFLSFGKLRTSYGITGNDQITDYQYLASYSSGPAYGGMTSLSPSRLANPDFSWETNKKLEASVDLGFFSDRILLTATYFKNHSGNQLVPYPLPSQSGFANYQANLPALVENKGWELELHSRTISGKDFNWDQSFLITLPKNRLLEYPGLASSSFANTYVIGEDLSVYKGYRFLGIDPQTGLPILEDQNKDGVLRFTNDAVVLGKTSPDFYGGLDNSFEYKAFRFDLFLQFVKQSAVGFKPTMGATLENLPRYVLNRWTRQGDQAEIMRATANSGNVSPLNISSAAFSDASFVRLKTIAFEYTPPAKLLKKLKLTNLRLYLEAQNLLTFDNKKRSDPEISETSVSIAPLRSVVGGVKITF